MIHIFRIVKKKYINSAFSGIGGMYSEGRWHSKGKPVVYTSMSASLAALEVLVHWQPGSIIPVFVLCHATLPKSCIESTYKKINLRDPANDQSLTQTVGDNWFNSSSALALEVPSVIIPFEYNFVINTSHPDYSKLKIEKIEDFSFDRRLIQ